MVLRAQLFYKLNNVQIDIYGFYVSQGQPSGLRYTMKPEFSATWS